MNLEQLTRIPAWEWPDGTDDFLLSILRDAKTSLADRLVAAELAGDYVVVNDRIALALLSLAADRNADEELRCTASVSLGPALEDADMMDPEAPEDAVITAETFATLRRGLRKVYMDADAPDRVRRSVLEAAVRAPEDWHREAVRGAYANRAPEWKLTAVFCMRFVEGFEKEVAETLSTDDSTLLREAILAAGNKEIEAAWPLVEQLLLDDGADRELRLAAIEAAAMIEPAEAAGLLADLCDSDDAELADAANEALAICSGTELYDDDELAAFDAYEDEEDDDRV